MSLAVLNLHSCQLPDDMFAPVLRSLAFQCPTLRELDLSNNDLSGAIMQDNGWLAWLSSESMRKGLRRLVLAGNPLGSGALCLLAEALPRTRLQALDISDTGANQDSLRALFDAICVRFPHRFPLFFFVLFIRSYFFFFFLLCCFFFASVFVFSRVSVFFFLHVFLLLLGLLSSFFFYYRYTSFRAT